MRKKGWAILLAGIAVVVLAGYFLSQAAVAAQSGPNAGSNSNAGDRKIVGKWVNELATADMDRSAVKGIQKTVNIPPAAFTSDGYAEGYYFKSFAGGYLEGYGGSMVAPVIFPKGAKKILYVDYYVWDESGSAGGYLAMYDSYPWGSYVYKIIGGATYYNTGWTRYRGYPLDNIIYPTDVWYVTFYGSGGWVYLKGVVVTYQ